MRIGILLPSIFSVDNPGNGIAAQARQQAAALERLGHTVIRLSPWQWQDEGALDVLHMYLGGLQMHGIAYERRLTKPGILVFSPIIDSNQSFFSYRLASAAGSIWSRVVTVPGSLRNQALQSDVIICRSRHEQQRVVRGLGISKNKTEIVLNGCDLPAIDRSEVEKLRGELELPKKFILHVSAYTQPRKNVLRLVEAARQLNYPLVLAGHATRGNIMKKLELQSSYAAGLRLLPFVDERTKAALYAMCDVFCLPSIHEGTGLVALEAAAYGANVVITRNGGPPDYFEDYVEYVNPENLQDIKEALVKAWQKPRSLALKEHVARNLSWDHSARKLEAAYLHHLQVKGSIRGAAFMMETSECLPD